jgi:hypothetical protein
VYLAAVTVGIFAAFRAWGYDDPFITYRYAANLAHGAGFVYNPGEPVLSTTTPLLTIILAALSSLSDDLPAVANLLGAVALAAGGLCLWDLAARAGSRWGGLAGLTLYPTFGLVLSTMGSETPLYLFSCLAALAAYGRERYAWTAVACALAVLARPDGALVALVVSAHYLAARRPARLRDAPWPAALLFVVLLLPWLFFSQWQFGSVLPATLFAKQQQGIMAISERFAPGLLRAARNYTTPFPHLLAAPLAALGLVAFVLQARALIPLFLWTAAYVAAYSLLGVTSYFWYYAPLIPAAAVAVGLGLDAIMNAASRRPRAATLICAALLALIVAGQVANAYQQSLRPDRRIIAYTAVGRWLAANTPPQASVGMLEVGIIGYYSGRPIVDFAGLIQPEVAAQLGPNSTYDDAGIWAVNRYRPAYVVLPDGALPRLDAYVTGAGCQALQRFPGEAFAFRFDMTVYKCTW